MFQPLNDIFNNNSIKYILMGKSIEIFGENGIGI